MMGPFEGSNNPPNPTYEYNCSCGWKGNKYELKWKKVGRCIYEGDCPKCGKELDINDASD